eukprot:585360-Pelagomonas_calceolata.AAC.1
MLLEGAGGTVLLLAPSGAVASTGGGVLEAGPWGGGGALLAGWLAEGPLRGGMPLVGEAVPAMRLGGKAFCATP